MKARQVSNADSDADEYSVGVIASMGHAKLSMIASHLAVGGVLCCLDGKSWLNTVTSNKKERNSLEDFAYESLGCGHAYDLPFLLGSAPITEKEKVAVRRAKRYFAKFMEIL